MGSLERHTSDMAFQPHPEYQERKTSAVALIKLLLNNRKPEILSQHCGELLTILLWKLTEAELQNKYKTRYQTQGAMACGETKRTPTRTRLSTLKNDRPIARRQAGRGRQHSERPQLDAL